MPATEPVRLGTIILGAGRSSRMGQPKLLLPWRDTTVMGQLVAQWRAVGAEQIVPVCAPNDTALEAELDRLGIPAHDRVVNAKPDLGMFSSILAAATWIGWHPGLTHWAIVLGDQPHLRDTTLAAVVRACSQEPATVIQPAFQGRPAHPVLLAREAFAQMVHSKENTLHEFLDRFIGQICLVAVDDPGLELDLDRPEDYQRALNL